MIRILYCGSTSACMEIVNREIYYAAEPYELYLNGSFIRSDRTNVFSLFGLCPSTDYILEVRQGDRGESMVFTTTDESCAVNVRDFGAVGDGITEDTPAIQAAIHFLPEGGRLYFPEGRYLTLPLALKSHITLEFSEGAALLGSADRKRYPVLPGAVAGINGEELYFGVFEGCVKPMYQALITAQYAHDITIIGPGTVDGNAGNSDFWTEFKSFSPARPRLFFLNRCENVIFHGITGCNSASWHFHPFCSKRVSFYDVTVKAPKNSPNTDAVDPESCDGVEIVGCRFCVGDDCIAIKSGKIELGRKLHIPADHITIRNCLMEYGHGAVTLGSETASGVRNLKVSQCLFRNTDRGLRIKTRRGRGEGCAITGVQFENIRMEGVLTPVVINMWYNCGDADGNSEYVASRKALPVDDRTPRLGCFRFRDLDCAGAQVAACYVDGLPEMPIDKVAFENVRIAFADDAKPGIPAMEEHAGLCCRMGMYFDHVRRVYLRNVRLDGVNGEKLIAYHCGEITTESR